MKVLFTQNSFIRKQMNFSLVYRNTHNWAPNTSNKWVQGTYTNTLHKRWDLIRPRIGLTRLSFIWISFASCWKLRKRNLIEWNRHMNRGSSYRRTCRGRKGEDFCCTWLPLRAFICERKRRPWFEVSVTLPCTANRFSVGSRWLILSPKRRITFVKPSWILSIWCLRTKFGSNGAFPYNSICTLINGNVYSMTER